MSPLGVPYNTTNPVLPHRQQSRGIVLVLRLPTNEKRKKKNLKENPKPKAKKKSCPHKSLRAMSNTTPSTSLALRVIPPSRLWSKKKKKKNVKTKLELNQNSSTFYEQPSVSGGQATPNKQLLPSNAHCPSTF